MCIRDRLVTAQATLEDYKLQLKQLLELDGENEMNIYLPTPVSYTHLDVYKRQV